MIIEPLKDKRFLQCCKKMAVLGKLYRLELITEHEYIVAKNKILDSYNIVDKGALVSYQ